MGIQVKVEGPKGNQKVIDLCDTEDQLQKITVLQLKQKIIQEFSIHDELRIVYTTKALEDKAFLVSYGIQHMSTIQSLLMLPGGI